ncbi:hypothetical protein Syun_025814 [Stephania yunnanensis]|uniref:Pentatricopeptide repeat-containing protein n=1 Tax=Stephania yunnanensis TaxID=152371 RepID=A0AAP0F183_9MAGN
MNDFNLVLNFFNWVRLRKETSVVARCIVIHVSAALRHPKTARDLIRGFWASAGGLDIGNSFRHFVEQLVYTYKDWGSDPTIFDIVFQVLVEVGLFVKAKKLFDKMFNYGVVMSVGSCIIFRGGCRTMLIGLTWLLRFSGSFRNRVFVGIR